MNAFDSGAASVDYAEHASIRDVGGDAGTWGPPAVDRARIDLRALRGLLSRARAAFLDAASVDPRWQDFLGRLTQEPVGLSEAHARAVRQVWAELEVGVGPALPLPSVEPSDDGAVTLSWSTDGYFAEVTVHADGRHEWFFRSHASGAFEGTDEPTRGGPSHRFHALLTAALRA